MTDPTSVTAILFLGLTLKLIGFAVRDELWLRVLVTTGLTCDAIFYAVRPEPVLQSVLANVLLTSVNLVLIALILVERTTWGMSATDRETYSHFPTLTPGQFRRLRKIMQRSTTEEETELLREGQPVEALMLILSPRINIEKEGKTYPISGPTFVGEIALLTGNKSSASVSLPKGGTVIKLPLLRLRARMSRSPALSNAIVALFGQELARKVADSAPMERALRKKAGG
jgi:hypothetical protein